MAKNAAGAVTELGKTGTLKKMFSGLNEGLKPLSKVPGQFIKGIAQISVAASPAFKRVTTAAGRVFRPVFEAARPGGEERPPRKDHRSGPGDCQAVRASDWRYFRDARQRHEGRQRCGR
ncbi:hypothetical protein ACFQ51_34780 [Streptomyces kaempferi]